MRSWRLYVRQHNFIVFKNFLKHSCVLGLQFKQSVKASGPLVLALIDYVSRAHEIEICPSSIRRLSMSQLSLNLMHGYLSNFGLARMLLFFLIFEKKNTGIFLRIYFFSLTCNPVGVKISKRYFSYKSQPKVFKPVLNFPPNGPHKITFGIFLKFWVSDF